MVPNNENGTISSSTTDTENFFEASSHPLLTNNSDLKLPPFWKHEPLLWFMQAETLFKSYKVSNDEEKFQKVLVAIAQPDILNKIVDILQEPPETDKYLSIKDKLIKSFSDSKEKQLHKLLEGLSLDNKTPSQLLQEMRNCAPTGIANDVMMSLWFKRMPYAVRCILSANEGVNLDKLASFADKILEQNAMSTNQQTSAISYQQSTKDSTRLSQLEDQLQKMSTTLLELKTLVESGRGYTASRNLQQQQQRRSRSTSRSRQNVLCYYHSKFGTRANKCRQPCQFKTPTTEN